MYGIDGAYMVGRSNGSGNITGVFPLIAPLRANPAISRSVSIVMLTTGTTMAATINSAVVSNMSLILRTAATTLTGGFVIFYHTTREYIIFDARL